MDLRRSQTPFIPRPARLEVRDGQGVTLLSSKLQNKTARALSRSLARCCRLHGVEVGTEASIQLIVACLDNEAASMGEEDGKAEG